MDFATNPPCGACKGACCGKQMAPGATVPSDWPQPLAESLDAALASGQWCITVVPTPSSLKLLAVSPMVKDGSCVFLTQTGCSLGEQKPLGCKVFIASDNFPMGCHYPKEVTLGGERHPGVHFAKFWMKHRPLLDELTDRYQRIE